MADTLKPELCILGGGALGISLAIAARERGASVVLIVRDGDEPGDGAQARLQRAAFLASAARAQAIRTAGRLGLDHAEPKPGFKAIAEHAAAVADAMVPRDAPERLAALGVTVLAGPAAFTDRTTLKAGDSLIRASQFVLATGSRPMIPALPGLDQVPFFTPDSILDNIRKLTHLLVIGGDATALELAQAFRRLGSAVTLVPQGEILSGFEREAVAILLRALGEEGIDIIEGASVKAVLPRSQGTGIAITRADGTEDSLDISHILVATGRQPELDAAMLGKAKLRADPARPGYLLVGPNGQTSNGRISAIGGAAGIDDPALAQTHSRLLLDRLLGAGKWSLDPLRVVRHVGTVPALAQVGQLESSRPLRTGQVVLRANPAETEAARAAAETTAGSLKLLVSAQGAVLGGAMVGPGAIEVLALLALAMDRGTPIDELGRLQLPANSPAAPLADLGRQFAAQQKPGRMRKLRVALRRLFG